MNEHKFDIIANRFLQQQVCCDKHMTIEEATEKLNRINPCGTRNGWIYDESLGIVQCEEDKTRIHLMFKC